MSANATTVAPTGRKKLAQGKERSDAALGHDSQNTSSPEGAKEGGNSSSVSNDGKNRKLWPLPSTWNWSTIGEVSEVIRGASPRPKGDPRYFGGPIPWISIADLTRQPGKYLHHTREGVTKAGAELSRLIPAGEIILSNSATVCVPKILKVDGCIHDGFVAFPTLKEKVDLDFAYYWFEFVRPTMIQENRQGITQVNLNTGIVRAMHFPLAPRKDQRRIVAEIEKQFTRLEAGVAALRRVQANLKRYRAAVLKAACEGRLVPTEAELHRKLKTKNSKLETGAQFLARILTERRQNWQGRGQYKEPAAPNTTNLPTLPETWTWVSWEMVLAHEDGAFKRGPFGSALTKAIFVEKGFKVYEQYCPINDDCSFARYYITPEKFEELQAFEVKAGDYLISCSGVTLGRITRVPEQFERGIINQALLRVRINESLIDHRYFLHLFRSALFQKAIFDNSTGSAIPNVKGVKELKAMAIPLPPLAEQTRIVAEVERRLSVVEELESVVSANLQRATRLRQSILQKAFTGELT